jgi:RecA-family ATPase
MADLGEDIVFAEHLDSEDHISDFELFVREQGLEPRGGVRADGRIHRCPTRGKRTEKDGAYCLYLDGLDTWGWCQDWRVDDKPAIWRPQGFQTIDIASYDVMQGRIVADRLAYEAARQDSAAVDFEPICAGTLLRHPAPPRRWLVPGWIPKNVVTLLGGDGGVGKSTLAMQLGAAAATGAFWLGADVNKTRTFVLSAEDDQDEMHFRLEKILEGLPGGREANRIALEGNLWLLDATDELDPTLATYDAAKRIAPTDTYSRIAEFIGENNIGLFIADSAADVFAEEIDRHAVRSFIRQLKAIGCTVLLLGHPSVDGMKTGRGYSGSTHWNNAVRSRLYFTRAEADPDLRILDMPKANRARAGQRKVLRWTENGFVHDTAAENALNGIGQQLKAEEAFLRLLKQFCEEGRAPSPKPSSTYAPKAFASHPESEGISKDAFKKAMDLLLSAGKIQIVTEGPPSRRYQYLRVKEDGVGDDGLGEDGLGEDGLVED